MSNPERSNQQQPYQLGAVVAYGAFGTLFQIHDKEPAAPKVLKVVRCSTWEQFVQRTGSTLTIDNEAVVLQSLHHPNIVQLYSYVLTDTRLNMKLEYFPASDLFDYVTKSDDIIHQDVLHMTSEILAAATFIHSHGILHRDLTLPNIVRTGYAAPPMIKIIDFAFSKLARSGCHTICGTPSYMAPELHLQLTTKTSAPYGYEIDAWSLGVLIYALNFGIMPFDVGSSGLPELAPPWVLDYPSVPVPPPVAVKSAITHLLVVDPTERAQFLTNTVPTQPRSEADPPTKKPTPNTSLLPVSITCAQQLRDQFIEDYKANRASEQDTRDVCIVGKYAKYDPTIFEAGFPFFGSAMGPTFRMKGTLRDGQGCLRDVTIWQDAARELFEMDGSTLFGMCEACEDPDTQEAFLHVLNNNADKEFKFFCTLRLWTSSAGSSSASTQGSRTNKVFVHVNIDAAYAVS